uniref:non-specific serine/threonine protein kinase n=1 Tax=Cannabis sativa TaxID=3483 RepID=A0A803PS02_CANSA
MVSSQFCGLTKPHLNKSIQNQLLLPRNPTDSVVSEQLELDFSDVFGPLPVPPTPIEVNFGDSEDSNELVYDDPVVIYNRSHSLVGPSSFVSQSLNLNKLTISETEEVVECVDRDTKAVQNEKVQNQDAYIEDGMVEKDNTAAQTVGIEDFEVLKVVGQGAFAKVYQVRKKGTLDIYAMKVMRKDKIMEKNHAEYMKAERDILTQIDHPFIVQLRYSFQTKYKLYLVLDFVNGGHLFFQLYHQGLFRGSCTYICC